MAGAERQTVGGGALRDLLALEKRIEVSDGAGNTLGEWAEQFRAAARRESLKGGETVMAARLEKRQPYIVTIRGTPESVLLTPDWRAKDVRSGALYNITSVVVRPRGDYVDLLVTDGQATG